jgi:hypothetical protein
MGTYHTVIKRTGTYCTGTYRPCTMGNAGGGNGSRNTVISVWSWILIFVSFYFCFHILIQPFLYNLVPVFFM